MALKEGCLASLNIQSENEQQQSWGRPFRQEKIGLRAHQERRAPVEIFPQFPSTFCIPFTLASSSVLPNLHGLISLPHLSFSLCGTSKKQYERKWRGTGVCCERMARVSSPENIEGRQGGIIGSIFFSPSSYSLFLLGYGRCMGDNEGHLVPRGTPQSSQERPVLFISGIENPEPLRI